MSKPIFATAEEAEQAFYEALANCDLEAMMAVWAEDEEVICIHPGGPRFSGFAAVREVWRQLFASGLKLKVSISQPVKNQAMLLAVHCVLEHISVDGDNTIAPPMIATNVYTRGASGWHMVVHHTSPAPDSDALMHNESPRVVH